MQDVGNVVAVLLIVRRLIINSPESGFLPPHREGLCSPLPSASSPLQFVHMCSQVCFHLPASVIAKPGVLFFQRPGGVKGRGCLGPPFEEES